MASAQDHAHAEPFGVTAIGALAKPTLSATLTRLSDLKSRPAADVASIQIAHLPPAEQGLVLVEAIRGGAGRSVGLHQIDVDR